MWHSVPIRPKPYTEKMDGFRHSQQLHARMLIAGSAIDIFRKQGYDSTSMEDVATEAGVSRRTLYRYFKSKEDLVFEQPRQWFEIQQTAIESRSDKESTRELFHRAILDVASAIADDPSPVLNAFDVLQSSTTLLERHSASDAAWIAVWRDLILADIGKDKAAILRASVVASALTAATNALIAVWALDPKQDFMTLTQTTLDQLDPIWPVASR